MVQAALFTLSQFGVTDEQIARELDVAPSTVHRWRSGKTQPQPLHEGDLRRLANDLSADTVRRVELFEAAVDRCLREVREALHRHAKLSSRNEALDAIAELFQGHIAALRSGATGITTESLASSAPAQALHDFICQYGNPDSQLSNSLFRGGPNPSTWRDSDNQLAIEIIDAFDIMNNSTPLIENIANGGDLLNLAFGRFLADSFQDEKELGQYLTPTEVIQFMVELALQEMSPSEREALSDPKTFHDFGYVLDPSCGVGSFLAEFIRAAHPQVAPSSKGWSQHAASSLIVGADKSERMIRLAKANLALFGTDDTLFIQGNSLARFGTESVPLNELNGKVGLILTNPPFGATFSGSALDGYKLATSWASKAYSSIDSELLFLERYLDWLRPGGQLLAVVPDSILTNKGIFDDLRRGLKENIELRTVISLPPVTFAAAGTATKTSVLHLRKIKRPGIGARFAICRDVGYSVSSRGAQRRKIFDGINELPQIMRQIKCEEYSDRLRFVEDFDENNRWDATYHASLPLDIEREIAENNSLVRVGDVCKLSKARLDPRKLQDPTFQYIEISDVDGQELSVSAKETLCSKAPSRARNLVREGDILISTVRPERKTLGVVPAHLDGAICSTGFAVLESTNIAPLALAALLQTDFVTQQILRYNVGIAYPAIESKILPKLVLPVDSASLETLSEAAIRYQNARDSFEEEKASFFQEVSRNTSGFMRDSKSEIDR